MPAAKFPRIDINLIDANDFSHTPVGRLLTWATTYGRYIMILTEIIVLLSFISRFSLDRRLTDLNEEIGQKQAIIETNKDLEAKILAVQKKLQTLKVLTKTQAEPVTTVLDVQKALPSDVYLKSLDISEKNVKMSVVSGTTLGISSFLSSLQTNSRFGVIEIGDIKSQQVGGSTFDVVIQLDKPTPKKNK